MVRIPDAPDGRAARERRVLPAGVAIAGVGRVLVVVALATLLGASAAPALPPPPPPQPHTTAWTLPAGSPVRAKISAVLAGQAAALGRGDAAAFLAPVAEPVRAAMRRRFDSLRALRAVDVTVRLAGEPTQVDGDRWQASVDIGFCAAAPGCAQAPARATTEWVVSDLPQLVAYTPSTEFGPRPWETTTLAAVVGKRVVVAATPAFANRLAATLAAAEQAAAQADEYARWRPRPVRYLVYLAGPDEWASWYGSRQPPWAAGFAMPITTEHTEIVLNATRIGGEIRSTLAHEFTHVTSLAGVQRGYTESWLLVEGLAEYVSNKGRAPRTYRWLSGTRRYVAGGGWPGSAALAAPPQSAAVGDVTGSYGTAYLAVRWLAEHYGEERMLAFFAAVARDGQRPEIAAPATLGAEWATAAAGCDAYIRQIVGN